MKPFDLAKALAGEPVLTKYQDVAEYHFSIMNRPHGRSFHIFKMTDSKGGNEYFNIVDDYGRAYSDLSNSLPRSGFYDLFMAPVKKQEWYNVYSHVNSITTPYSLGAGHFPSQQEAEYFAKEQGSPNYVKSVLIREWEE